MEVGIILNVAAALGNNDVKYEPNYLTESDAPPQTTFIQYCESAYKVKYVVANGGVKIISADKQHGMVVKG